MTLCDIDEKIKTRPSLIEFSLQQSSEAISRERTTKRMSFESMTRNVSQK